MLDSLKAGFEFDPESGKFTAAEGRIPIDQSVSKMLGFAADEFGNPVTGADGNPLQIDKDSDVDWGNYQDRYGNTVFYDKSNPGNTFNPSGTRVYQSPTGQPSSSPTSNSDGVQVLGQGEPFQRDDGSQGLLGENCVKYARTIVPNLPWGLNDKQDKINAVNSAVEQGFGSRGGSQAQVGDAILTGEGGVGHAAVVVGVDPQTGDLILEEANYQSGMVTEGRRIAMDDPTIYGTISSTAQPQMSSVINEDGANEGNNPGIMADVIAQTPEAQQVEFTRQQDVQFDNWEASNFDPKELPAEYRTNEGEIQFKNEYAVWAAQQSNKKPNQEILDAAESGTFEDIIKASSNSDKTPDQGFRTSWNKATTVAGQFEAITNLIGKGSTTKTDAFGNSETIDWSPLSGWIAERILGIQMHNNYNHY